MNASGWLSIVPKLCLLLAVLVAVTPSAEGRIRHYRWKVQYEYRSPDCYGKLVMAINGQSPGPTIRAQQGDTIYVELQNGLFTENVLIHWHGIRQIGTPWSDGTEGVSQCPLQPGETFVYKFVVDRPGTYWYHGHYGMQRAAGLYGSIQVALADGAKEPFAYDGESSILLNDWWHRSTSEQEVGLSSVPFRWVGEPQSLLIEGRGSYNRSLEQNSAARGVSCKPTHPDCSPPHVMPVEAGKTYRLRIASVASLSSLNFHIEGHNMTVVEADGYYVEPVTVNNLDIYSGQTYSVLVRADRDPSRNYWAALNVRGHRPATPTGRAIWNYIPNPPGKLPPSTPWTGPTWNDTAYSKAQANLYKARKGYVTPPPATSDRRIVLLNTQNTIDGHTRWAINNVSYVSPETPHLISLKYNKWTPPPQDTYRRPYDIFEPPPNPNATYGSSVYRLRFNSTVDVVLQNANILQKNTSEIHPWHLHGHVFWVLAHGDGVFDPVNDTVKFNVRDPPLRNTVPLFPYGWTALRFVADNPGVWAFHCHVDTHFFMGMAVVFAEGVDRVPTLPTSIMGCGRSKRLIRP